MDFYLLDPDPSGPQFQLPVWPVGDVKIQRQKNLETVNIINIGEIDFAQGEKVKEITFSSFFPLAYDPGYCRYASIPDPQAAMDQLTAWTVGTKPVRFIITDTSINTLVMVSAYATTFVGGEPGDVYYDITLRTWRKVQVRTTAEAAAATSASGIAIQRPDTKPVPAVYVVKPGDTLYKIAKMQLGSGGRWNDIYTIPANLKTIGPDPNVIQVGQKLVLPA